MKTRHATTDLPKTEQQTRHLYWWLLLALAFEYARPGSWIPGIDALHLNSLIPLSLLVVSTFAKGMRPAREIFADPIAKWMVVFLSLVVLSVFHAAVTEYTVETITEVLGRFFLFWMIARITTSTARIHGVILTLLVAHIFLLAMNPSVVLDPTSRHYIQGATFLGDGNDFALSLCILLPFCIELALSTRVK